MGFVKSPRRTIPYFSIAAILAGLATMLMIAQLGIRAVGQMRFGGGKIYDNTKKELDC